MIRCDQSVATILTRNYAPFDYKHPRPPYYLHEFAADQGIFISHLRLPRPYMENLITTEELCNSDEWEEG